MADQNNTPSSVQRDEAPEGDGYLPSAMEGNEVFGEGEEAEFNDILSDASRYQTTGVGERSSPGVEDDNEHEEQSSSHEPELEEQSSLEERSEEHSPSSEEEQSSSPLEWTEREQRLLQLLEQAGGAVLGNNRQQPNEDLSDIVAQSHDFIGDFELDDLLDTKEGLNSLLNKVYQAGVEASARSVMQRVPEVINSRIERHQNLNRIVEDFYSVNPDLSSMKQTVAIVTQEILNKEPDLPMNELLERAGTQTRSLLGMRAPRAPRGQSPRRNPGFVNGSTARQPRRTDDRTDFQKEIDEMLNL